MQPASNNNQPPYSDLQDFGPKMKGLILACMGWLCWLLVEKMASASQIGDCGEMVMSSSLPVVVLLEFWYTRSLTSFGEIGADLPA